MSRLMRRGIGPLIVAAAGVVMLIATWGTWPDPITDFGKELYIAWQISLGRHLYSDVAYHLGPLSPYVNALAMKIFGPTLASIEILNFFVLAATVALMYRLICQIAGDFAAAVGCVAFVTLFAFVHFTPIADYNFIAPYDHAHTHGLLLGLVSLMSADHFVRTKRRWTLIVAGAALGLTFLTRAELFVAAAGGTLTVLLLAPKPKPRDGHPWALFLIAFLAPILIAFLLLPARGVLGSWPILFQTSVAASRFYRDSMGTLDIPASLWRLARWSFIWLAILIPACFASRKWTIPAFFWAAGIAYLAGRWNDPAEAFAPLPLALIACLFFLRSHPISAKPLAIGAILWALLLLGKILLNARVYHYGFALAMPATLLVLAIGVGLTSWPVRAAVLGALTVAVAAYLTLAFSLISKQVNPVAQDGDQFWADERGGMMNQVLLALRPKYSPGQTLAVIPEGAMLNFLTKMDNPTPYWSFNPPYAFFAGGQGEAAGERKMLLALQAHPPDWVVLVAEDQSDLGTPFFGKDYGLSIYGFLQRNYRREISFGEAPFVAKSFGMMLMRRVGYNVPTPPAGEPNAVSPR